MPIITSTINYPNKLTRSGWLICDLGYSLYDYYKAISRMPYMSPPVNGVHLTIVRGEYEPVEESLLQRYNGTELVINYGHELWTNGRSYWLVAASQEVDRIRQSLGLDVKPLHITIGNTKNISRLKYEPRIYES